MATGASLQTARKFHFTTPQHPRVSATAREIGFLVAAGLLYTLVRGLTSDRLDAAFRHAEQVISFERRWGLLVETDLQGLILDHQWLVDAANNVYIYGYWPTFFGTILWLILRRPGAYPLYRNAILASGAFSLTLFALFPLAPPRFLPEHGFVDTIAIGAPAYRELNSAPFVNEYAAMPSLHFGWILLVGIAWVALSRHLLIRTLGATMPAVMFAAIILTGNHYIVDALVGGSVVVAGLTVAVLIERAKRRRVVLPAITDAREHSGAPEDAATVIPAQRPDGADCLTG